MTLFVLLCVFECMRVAFFNCTILFQKILITKPEQSKPLAGKILGRTRLPGAVPQPLFYLWL